MSLFLQQLNVAQHRNAIGRLLVDHLVRRIRNITLRDEQTIREIVRLLMVVLPQREIVLIANDLTVFVHQHVFGVEALDDDRFEKVTQFVQRFSTFHISAGNNK